MHLTELEYEAFLRGRAAGLIPADVSLPTCDKEIDELILHVGFLFCREIAYRNRQKKLRLMTLSAFTEEHLNDLIVRLPELRPEEVFTVAGLQRAVYLNPLEGLYHYFSFGRKIVSADDLAGRLAADVTPIPSSQILRGFEMEYVPVTRTGLATSRQKAVLAEMICNGRLPTITRRQWENMTEEEASQLISSAPKPKAELPVSVALVLNVIDRLNSEEKTLLDELMNQHNTQEREIA